MKFSSTVDSLSQENRHLRRVIMILGFGIVLLTLAVLLLYDRPPKLAFRSSRGLELLSVTALQRTQTDVEQAARLMLKARLETDAIAPEAYLSQRQMDLRAAEQRELKSRGLTQAIVVRSIELRDGIAVANFDRVFSIGEVRSAIPTKASIAFEEIQPNELNPYGMRLAILTPIDAQPPSGSAPVPPGAPVPPKKGDGK